MVYYRKTAEQQGEKLIKELRAQNTKGEAYFGREQNAVQEQLQAALLEAGKHKASCERVEKALAAKAKEVESASAAVQDAVRARREGEKELVALRKRQEKLRSYTDEQVEAKIAAEREKIRFEMKANQMESADRRSDESLKKAVGNAERANLRLQDELTQVVHERDQLMLQVRMRA